MPVAPQPVPAETREGRDWLRGIGFRLPVSRSSMRAVTPNMAAAMFKREFWDRLRRDSLPLRHACALYDAAVNSGCAQSVKLAQRGFNTCVGPYGVKLAVDGIIQARRDFFESLARDKPSQTVFLAGSIGPMP